MLCVMIHNGQITVQQGGTVFIVQYSNNTQAESKVSDVLAAWRAGTLVFLPGQPAGSVPRAEPV